MIPVTNAEFLEALFHDLPDGAAALTCSFAGDPGAAARGAWFALPWAFGERPEVHGAQNTYCCVSSFWPDPQMGSYRRRKASFARLHGLMLDDLNTKIPMTCAHRLRPSALVETSPGNFQAWLFLEPGEVTDDRERAERLIDAMIRKGLAAQADPGMAGVTRYGRLPVGINGKAKYLRDGQVFRVRVVEWSPETRYSVAGVAQAFGLDLAPTAPAARPSGLPVPVGVAYRRIDDFAAMLEVMRAAGLHLETLGEGRHSVICPWANEHTGGDVTGTAIFEPSAANGWVGGFRCHHGHGEALHVGHLYGFARNLSRGAA